MIAKKTNKKNSKIAVAMSGGVDSSVAAALTIKKYGQENVFGVTAKLFCYGGETQNGPIRHAQSASGKRPCCSLDAINDAKAVCEKLGIPHYVISEEKDFEQAVIKNFIDAYRHGQTPIPCIPCNTLIKFGTMMEHVKKLGAEKLATGHYARITQNSKLKTQNYQLQRGLDPAKDQSYFLYGLNQQQLSQTEFPIGSMTKSNVRKMATKLELKTAEKKESQGVCFVNEGTVADWLQDKVERKPGNIVDSKGNIIGKHDGIVLYTIGQRKRIGGGYPKPMFVVGIDPIENEVIIGTKDELCRKELSVMGLHWINPVKLPLNCTAKIRYNMEDEKCIVIIKKSKFIGEHYIVRFNNPQRAITPGQSVVFYKGDTCLGGGIIAG